jgi:large subunit ribosomal protein L9
MKVILTQDVPKLGVAGTVQDVANGYARNYLIPQGMASVATAGSIKQVEERQAAEARKTAKLEEELRGLSDRIQGMRVQIQARVGEQGRLYGSVTSSDVADELSKLVGEEIDRRKVDLEEPIRSAGEHQVTVRLVGRLQPTITVVVWDPEAPVEAAAGTDTDTDSAMSPEESEAAELTFDAEESLDANLVVDTEPDVTE